MESSKVLLAGCVISNKQGELLLLHRAETDKWEMPGGKVEPGESGPEAAGREVTEELGCQVRIMRELGRQTFKLEQREYDYTWYEAQITQGEPSAVESIHDQISWFSLAALCQTDNLSENMQNFIRQWSEDRIALRA